MFALLLARQSMAAPIRSTGRLSALRGEYQKPLLGAYLSNNHCCDQTSPPFSLYSLSLLHPAFTPTMNLACHVPLRYYFFVLTTVILIHFLLSATHESYGHATSLCRVLPAWVTKSTSRSRCEPPLSQLGKANATFVILARNSELKDIIRSLTQIEDKFNKKHHYPYVFLNNVPFTEEFKEWTSNIVSSKTSYGLIPHDHWNQPDDIDEVRAAASREQMAKDGMPYGDSVSYRNMCRYYSGFFFRHELLQQYRYYWRIEPGVDFFCDILDDPFVFMRDHDKVYGFTISLHEFVPTIPTLWETTKDFIRDHPEYVPEDNAMAFVSEDGGESYNFCHFWSNFEIADMNFWRSEAYMKYFEFLDSKGGFYYERWGDAPVHSLGVSLLARKDQIHLFSDIGYRHSPYQFCPQGELNQRGKCSCNETETIFGGWACNERFTQVI